MVNIILAYNFILGHTILNCHDKVINMDYLCLKLTTLGGVAVVQDSQKSAHECYKHSTKDLRKLIMPFDLLEKLESFTNPNLADPIEEIILEHDKKVHFGATLNDDIKEALINLLKSRIMTFA